MLNEKHTALMRINSCDKITIFHPSKSGLFQDYVCGIEICLYGQFGRLERVEIGGTKGKLLTLTVKQIHLDFMKAAETFQGVQYDVLNVDAQEFHRDYYNFRSTIKELERRLGAVVLQVGSM